MYSCLPFGLKSVSHQFYHFRVSVFHTICRPAAGWTCARYIEILAQEYTIFIPFLYGQKASFASDENLCGSDAKFLKIRVTKADTHALNRISKSFFFYVHCNAGSVMEASLVRPTGDFVNWEIIYCIHGNWLNVSVITNPYVCWIFYFI